MYKDFIQEILRATSDQEPALGLVGFEDDSGSYAITVEDDPNKLYVRVMDGTIESPTEAISFGVPRLPDYPVLIYYNKKEAYAVPDPNRELDYKGSNEGIAAVPPHSHEPGFGLFDVVSTRRMREGQVTVTLPYSMSVDVSGMKYWDGDGHERWFNGGTIDLTAYIPGSANTHRMCKIYLNRVTGELGVAVADPKSILIPMSEQDIVNIVLSQHQKSLSGVVLHNGMTAIDDERMIWDWRFWIGDFLSATGVNASGVGGAQELADLLDVLSASQTANFILAAGDGTSGGLYRGRALVANDIPSLAASKITSGTLLHERGGLEADVSAYDGYIRISGGTTSQIKSVFSSSSSPTANDDSGDGYVVGSRWINTTTDEEFVCLDNTLAAAIWKKTTPAPGPFSGVHCYFGTNAAEVYDNDVYYVVDYTSEHYDSDGYHSDVTNPSRLTVPTGKAGYYHIHASILVYDEVAQTGVVGIRFLINGLTISGNSYVQQFVALSPQGGVYFPTLQTDLDYYLNAGDYVQVVIFKNTNDTVNPIFGVPNNFYMHLIGT